MITRNQNTDFEWAKYQYKLINNNNDNDKNPEWETPGSDQTTTINEDKILCSDDTGVAFKSTNDILSKLRTYGQITQKNHLLVNWSKVFILTDEKQKVQNAVKTLPPPYDKIKCVPKGKILGRIMEPNKNMNHAVTENIRKAKTARHATKTT